MLWATGCASMKNCAAASLFSLNSVSASAFEIAALARWLTVGSVRMRRSARCARGSRAKVRNY